MSPRPIVRARPRPSPVGLSVAIIAAALLLAGCSIGAPAFDPSGPCVADGRLPGAYPELEALVPRSFDGRAPDQLDSGRNCTDANLGTLSGHGIREVRFAGGLWKTGAESGVTLAVFRADGLTADLMGEFYKAGALASSKISSYQTSQPTVAGRPGYRLDVENDGRIQSIVAWPDASAGTIRVALVSSAARDGATLASHDATVQKALAADSG